MTAPWCLAQRSTGVVHVGQPLVACPSEPGIGLVLEIQQADVPQGLRAEAADLDVVLQDGEGLADWFGRRLEELALEVVAGSPGQDAADVQALSLDLEQHVVGVDALGGAGVVGAARGVDVVVAAVEAVRPGG